MFDFRLDNKVALIVGGSRGIGRSIATAFAQAGARVVVSSRRQSSCDVFAEELRSEGYEAFGMCCNIGDPESLASLVSQVMEKFGRLDVLVNNAAVNPYYGPVLETPLTAIDKSLMTNIRGTFLLNQLGGEVMSSNGQGSIINTASVVGFEPYPLQGVYAVAKAAILNMTRVFACELGALGVRVNSLVPGFTKTDFSAVLFEDPAAYGNAVASIPMGRHAVPEELCGAALLLASDAGSYINGQQIVVDGGALATRYNNQLL